MQLVKAGLTLAMLAHHPVIAPALPPLERAGASWYSDASGRCASPAGCSFYGVANRTLAFGTKITVYYGGRQVHAVVDDRGPFVDEGYRLWDLNEHVASATGFSGVRTIGYRMGWW